LLYFADGQKTSDNRNADSKVIIGASRGVTFQHLNTIFIKIFLNSALEGSGALGRSMGKPI